MSSVFKKTQQLERLSKSKFDEDLDEDREPIISDSEDSSDAEGQDSGSQDGDHAAI